VEVRVRDPDHPDSVSDELSWRLKPGLMEVVVMVVHMVSDELS